MHSGGRQHQTIDVGLASVRKKRRHELEYVKRRSEQIRREAQQLRRLADRLNQEAAILAQRSMELERQVALLIHERKRYESQIPILPGLQTRSSRTSSLPCNRSNYSNVQ